MAKRAPAIEPKESRDALINNTSPLFIGNNQAVLRHITGRMSINILRVYLAILGHVNKRTGQAYPSQARIAEMLNCSTKTVGRCAKRLKEFGMIAITHRPVKDGSGKYHNIYRPIFDTEGLSAEDVRSIASLTGSPAHIGHLSVPHANVLPIRQSGVPHGHLSGNSDASYQTPRCPPRISDSQVSPELSEHKNIMDTKLENPIEIVKAWRAYVTMHSDGDVIANEADLATATALASKGITAAQLEDAVCEHLDAPRLAQAVSHLL